MPPPPRRQRSSRIITAFAARRVFVSTPTRRFPMPRPYARAALAAAALLVVAPAFCQALDKIVFSTDWLAEAEHGGYYQAVAEGTYRKHGLDVTLKPGGPQVNGLQLLAAGQLDIAMADALQVTSAVEQNVP